ncbi:MAG: hypothetical protein J2P41_16575, partial [Blastocatellia bacterium]|nr:hypothetical protein [Blastocatellia bacterium]
MKINSRWLLSSIGTARGRERGSRCKCLTALLIGLTAWFSILAVSVSVLAQSSVQKLPTTNEANQPVDSSPAAAEVTQNPNTKSSTERTGRVNGDYAWSSAAEIGYRFVDSDGNRDRFLSDLYVRNGLRLLDFHMDARSISGNGGLFDFMRTDVINGGSDDSQSYYLRLEKARRYRFDATMRKFNFFEFIPSFAQGEHNFNLDQRVSDFNLKLFPQRSVRLNLGYSRSSATGPLATTYGVLGDTFPIGGQSRWESNDYRLSMDTSYRRWDFSL